ncbi:MAG: hypothetical protein ABIR32_16690 [Ilumatobacteraceae bacterium]
MAWTTFIDGELDTIADLHPMARVHRGDDHRRRLVTELDTVIGLADRGRIDRGVDEQFGAEHLDQLDLDGE